MHESGAEAGQGAQASSEKRLGPSVRAYNSKFQLETAPRAVPVMDFSVSRPPLKAQGVVAWQLPMHDAIFWHFSRVP